MPEQQTDELTERRHSGLGIASFGMSVAAWIMMVAVVMRRPNEPGYDLYTFLTILSLTSFVVALGLGVAGMFQREKKMSFVIAGLVLTLASFFFFAFAVLWLFGEPAILGD